MYHWLLPTRTWMRPSLGPEGAIRRTSRTLRCLPIRSVAPTLVARTRSPSKASPSRTFRQPDPRDALMLSGTKNFATDGVGSALPAASTARAVSSCGPDLRPLRVTRPSPQVSGLSLTVQAKPAPPSLVLSPTWRLRVRATGQSGRMSSCGVRVMKVLGTFVSTLIVVVAGVGS